jgi:IS5 family transposase
VRAAFATPLARIAQLLRQRRENRGREKIYALHAPEVECIGRGKARTRLEFRCKVSLATTNRPAPGGKVVLGARTLPGNPFDGHTLAAEIAQTERITGVTIERASVDRGDRGHDAEGRRSGEAHQSRVFVSGQKRGVTPTIRREIKRRAGIEPVIGHMKADGHLGRNVLAGAAGDAITLVLAAAGPPLRLLRAWLARLLLRSCSAFSPSAQPHLRCPHRSSLRPEIKFSRTTSRSSDARVALTTCPRLTPPGPRL